MPIKIPHSFLLHLCVNRRESPWSLTGGILFFVYLSIILTRGRGFDIFAAHPASPRHTGLRNHPLDMEAAMKPRLTLLACALLLTTLALAGSKDHIVTIKPEKPTVGKEITIRYNPTVKGATLFGAQAVDVQVLVSRSGEMPMLLESPMKQKGKSWEAKVKLEDPKSLFGMIRFVSRDVVDNNGEAYWDFLVSDRDGKPVKGAHLARSQSYFMSLPDFGRQKDLDRAREEALAEEELYPNRPETKFTIWRLEFSEKRQDEAWKQDVQRQLDKIAQEHSDDIRILWEVASWYKRIGLAEKGQEVEDRVIGKDPKGEFAWQLKLQRMYSVRDPAQRAEQALEFLKDFPDAESHQKSILVGFLIQAKQFDKAEEMIVSMEPPNGNLLNEIAWSYIEQEINIERGVEFAKKGVEALRNTNSGAKPPFISKKQWEQSGRTTLGFTLDTYAFGLFKLGRYKEAQEAYREAYDLTQGMNADINERLVQCYLQNGDYASAIEVTKECIEKSKYSDKLLEYGKEAFAKKEGSAEGFDRLVEAARKGAMAKAKEELLSKRVNKPAPDFEAKNLSGEVIQLSKLRGKVVVLDFWATWCGPCKMAFPFVQKVYEKFKDNSDVVILAVNTWESETGAERENLVKKFMEENKYTFSVVYDETKVVDKYKVEGIPTQFFIDREGTIQFKEVGFQGPEMEHTMSMMIDMLLSGEILSVK